MYYVQTHVYTLLVCTFLKLLLVCIFFNFYYNTSTIFEMYTSKVKCHDSKFAKIHVMINIYATTSLGHMVIFLIYFNFFQLYNVVLFLLHCCHQKGVKYFYLVQCIVYPGGEFDSSSMINYGGG